MLMMRNVLYIKENARIELIWRAEFQRIELPAGLRVTAARILKSLSGHRSMMGAVVVRLGIFFAKEATVACSAHSMVLIHSLRPWFLRHRPIPCASQLD